MFIDTHCHFDLAAHETGTTPETLILNMVENHVTKAVQVSIDPDGFAWSYDLARNTTNILFTAGIHPSSKANRNELLRLDDFIKTVYENNHNNLLFGIGECGLDYYHTKRPREEQHFSFHHQLELAHRYDLPVIIHSREAFDDTMAIIREHGWNKGIFHCFPGDKSQARAAIDAGYYISYAGNLTYKKAFNLHESAAYVPLDRILFETDAPFLSPVPKRGKTNVPHYIQHTYAFAANLRSIPIEKLADQVRKNALALAPQGWKS